MSEQYRTLSNAANHELFVELMNRGQYRAAAAMFVEVSYRTRYPLNFPAILSGMNNRTFQVELLEKYQSDPDAWNHKWNQDLATYKADLQFMWSLVSFKYEAHCAADRLKQGLMETKDDADAGGMRFLRGVMSYCIRREAQRSKKAEEFYLDIVESFETLNVIPDQQPTIATFNASAIGFWYTGE